MQQIQTTEAYRAPRPLRKPHALIVEDDMTHFMYLSALLREHDYQVTVVHDGSELINALEADDYDVVFLDIILPRMNGFDALRVMRTHPTYGATPVIVTSSRAMRDLFEQQPKSGQEAFLPKPVDAAHLNKLLNHLGGLHHVTH